ncbi:alpha/beta fold hydrolase [Altererythrobacter sp.]|uniref:alpha/beta fold hydrolase n=1 Tax=Altererythrobacter sp. TaxID=1872480 RepID=UPI003D0932E3
MANFVLVHGAWGSSAGYDRIAEGLFTAGHRVIAANLSGLGKWRDRMNACITLTDHIDDVCRQIEQTGFERFILVGHSYGGMVITGVATRLGAGIDAIAYIDAFLPKDGESLWDITGEFEHNHYIDSQKFKPGYVTPIMGADHPGKSPHPLLTLVEAVEFTGEEAKIPRRCYIFAKSWEPTPFRRFYNEVEDDPSWEVHVADSGHAVMNDQPEQLLEILLGLAG